MKTYKLVVAYDGKEFYGWQKTAAGPSIEQCLEEALAPLLKQKTLFLQAASRTDRGVHANCQIVSFSTEIPLDEQRFLRALQGLLPKTIHVKSVDKVQGNFHPTLDAISKEYIYFVDTASVQNPFHRNYAWHFPSKLSLSTMRHTADIICNMSDFSAFEGKCEKSKINTSMPKLYNVFVDEIEDYRYKITLHGSHFLYKMARNIAGKIVYMGAGKISDLSQESMTAPAHGLTLNSIFY